MGFFAVWANIGVVGGVVPDAAGVDGSQGLLSVVSLKTAAGRILFEKKIVLTSFGSTVLIVFYYFIR